MPEEELLERGGGNAPCVKLLSYMEAIHKCYLLYTDSSPYIEYALLVYVHLSLVICRVTIIREYLLSS